MLSKFLLSRCLQSERLISRVDGIRGLVGAEPHGIENCQCCEPFREASAHRTPRGYPKQVQVLITSHRTVGKVVLAAYAIRLELYTAPGNKVNVALREVRHAIHTVKVTGNGASCTRSSHDGAAPMVFNRVISHKVSNGHVVRLRTNGQRSLLY